jgi:hypothetical protein
LGEWGCGSRVNRNILVAFKSELTLGHFYWSEGALRWVGAFQFAERLRANVICMQHSADEMNMGLAVQVFHKDSWSVEHFMFNMAALSNEKKFINAFTRLAPHGSEIGDALSMQRVISSEVYLLTGPSIVNYSYVDAI